ncbi:MAG: hypothetical protein DIU71_13825 [Proteobacteria bacterium]|nr:MAG: hypothetical protein DIU71_13825 [Pseudomonadota bacterium]
MSDSAEASAPAVRADGRTPQAQELGTLFARHYSGLLALLVRQTRDTALAADILSDAIETTARHLESGRIVRPEAAAGYVYRVAMNLLRNYRRNIDNRPERRADPAVLETLPAGLGLDEALEERLARQVWEVVADLPTARDREIVKRFYLDEDDKAAICRDLGLSPVHFDKVVFRARQRLKALLEARGFKKSDFFSVLLVCV